MTGQRTWTTEAIHFVLLANRIKKPNTSKQAFEEEDIAIRCKPYCKEGHKPTAKGVKYVLMNMKHEFDPDSGRHGRASERVLEAIDNLHHQVENGLQMPVGANGMVLDNNMGPNNNMPLENNVPLDNDIIVDNAMDLNIRMAVNNNMAWGNAPVFNNPIGLQNNMTIPNGPIYRGIDWDIEMGIVWDNGVAYDVINRINYVYSSRSVYNYNTRKIHDYANNMVYDMVPLNTGVVE